MAQLTTIEIQTTDWIVKQDTVFIIFRKWIPLAKEPTDWKPKEKIKISSKRLAQLFEYPVKSNSAQKLARKDKGHHYILIKGKFHQQYIIVINKYVGAFSKLYIIFEWKNHCLGIFS